MVVLFSACFLHYTAPAHNTVPLGLKYLAIFFEEYEYPQNKGAEFESISLSALTLLLANPESESSFLE